MSIRAFVGDPKLTIWCPSGWEQTTVGNGTRSSSQTSYLGPSYIDRKNLHVLVHSYVTRILEADASNSTLPRFDAVEFTQDAGGKAAFLFPGVN